MIKEKIIIEVDPGIDDSLALLLAAKSEEFDILGFSVVSGNIEVNQATLNAIKALDMAGRSDIAVYKGQALPLVRNYVDATDTHGKDGIGENFYQVSDRSEKESSVDFIIRSLRQFPHEITLVALGPLGNMAVATEKDPEAMCLAKRILLMGGAAKIHGNCSPVAEYNFWCDPHGARRFFDANLPNVTMIGLDVTYPILLTPNMREMIKQFDTPLSRYVFDITQFYVDFHWKQERTLGCIINDPLVIAYALDPSLLTVKPATVEVETDGLAIGESIVDFDLRDKNRAVVQVAMTVDNRQFFKLFLSRVFDDHKEDIEMMFRKEMI